MANVTFQGVAPQSELGKSSPYRPELNGFDDDATPTWQMVPLGGTRFMKITVQGAKDWSVDISPSQSPTISVAPETGANRREGVYSIDGNHEGIASVIVRGPKNQDPKNQELGRLDVRVLRQRPMSVQFFLVSDSAGHSTKAKEDDVRGWVDDANAKVFSRQMNLTFAVTAVKPIRINQDLGNPIDFNKLNLDMPYVKRTNDSELRWHTITDNGDTNKAVFNVFCLWDFTTTGADAKLNGFVEGKQPISASQMAQSGANFNMCMMKDVDPDQNSNIPWAIFAHEAGHFLEGMPFHYDDSADALLLMHEREIGPRLAKRDIESMTKRW